jgi:hypothetical protein
MYRRLAFAAANLSLTAGGMLMVWAFLRPHADVQRLYSVFLGFAGLLVGGVQLAGAMSMPAAASQVTWRQLRPRWPLILGVLIIALIGVGVSVVATVVITSPDPQSGPQPAAPLRAPDSRPAPDTLPRRPP